MSRFTRYIPVGINNHYHLCLVVQNRSGNVLLAQGGLTSSISRKKAANVLREWKSQVKGSKFGKVVRQNYG